MVGIMVSTVGLDGFDSLGRWPYQLDRAFGVWEGGYTAWPSGFDSWADGYDSWAGALTVGQIPVV